MNKLYILVPILFLLSCYADDNAEPVEDRRMTDEDKSYMLFKEGSKWVYKNSLTDEQDFLTFSIYEDRTEVMSYYDPSTRESGDYIVNKFIYFYNRPNKSGMRVYNFSQGHQGLQYIMATNYTWNNEGAIYIMSPTLGAQVAYKDSFTTTVTDYKIAEVVNGQTYNDVVVIQTVVSGTSDTNTIKYHYAPNVGLIKRELVDSGYSWELIDYDIAQ